MLMEYVCNVKYSIGIPLSMFRFRLEYNGNAPTYHSAQYTFQDATYHV